MIEPRASLYHRHRFLAEIIVKAAWLYFRFLLSFRMVDDILVYRGILVAHETVREWVQKFGWDYANKFGRRTVHLGEKLHLDEVVITIKGVHHILRCAVDQDGFMLDVLVHKHSNTKAAKRFMRKLLSSQGHSPRVMVQQNEN